MFTTFKTMYSAITLASAKMAVGRYKIGSDFNKTLKSFTFHSMDNMQADNNQL